MELASVCRSMGASICVQILLILCCKLLQFRSFCFWKICWYIEFILKLCNTVFHHLLPMVWGLSTPHGLRVIFSWIYPFTPEILILTHQQQTAFENKVGKGAIAHNKQFLLFPQCCLLKQIIVPPFVHIFVIISLLAAKFVKPKIGVSGKGFKKFIVEFLSKRWWGFNLLQMTNFRLFKTQSFQTTISNLMKMAEHSFKWVENIVGSLWAISPFPTVFSKDLYCRQGLFWEKVKQYPVTALL